MPAIGEKISVSIVVPTYNERDNIQPLCDGIRRALDGAWDYEVIFVDDGSPDGTGGVVRRIAECDPRIRLIERPGKMGLGSAVVDGFGRAVGQYWAMMDADLSHRPEDLPRLLEGLSAADIVIGSRYIAGGNVRNSPHRRISSRLAAVVARLLLGITVRDPTSGFAAFRRDAIIPQLQTLDPKGFKLLLEILARCREARVQEEPIEFKQRRLGRSKFGVAEVLTFFRLCLELRRF